MEHDWIVVTDRTQAKPFVPFLCQTRGGDLVVGSRDFSGRWTAKLVPIELDVVAFQPLPARLTEEDHGAS